MDIYGILGHPVGHSLSPTIHTWAFGRAGLPKIYQAWDILPENLAGFMSSLSCHNVQGMSVTIPHKETIIPFLDSLSATARDIGAVNTVFRHKNLLRGENTDVTGFLAPLIQRGIRPETALVLGGGGAARAALYGLGTLGTQTFLTCRNELQGTALGHEMHANFVPWPERARLHPDLIVNATPLGMRGALEHHSPWSSSLKGCKTCYDLVYTPQITPFLKNAQVQGTAIISGLTMFIHQAAAQFALWTGQRFDIHGATRLAASRLHIQR